MEEQLELLGLWFNKPKVTSVQTMSARVEFGSGTGVLFKTTKKRHRVQPADLTEFYRIGEAHLLAKLPQSLIAESKKSACAKMNELRKICKVCR